jgi:hypothetical protein
MTPWLEFDEVGANAFREQGFTHLTETALLRISKTLTLTADCPAQNRVVSSFSMNS